MTATGIDFGTTNSVVAQWQADDVEVLPLDAHHLDADWRHPGFELLFPSVVGMSSLRRGPLFGWEAKLRSEEAAEACKRLLKSDEYVNVQGRRFAATTVAAGVFTAMKEGARHNLTDIDRAVITVPANATGAARYRTRAAARFAGIEVQALRPLRGQASGRSAARTRNPVPRHRVPDRRPRQPPGAHGGGWLGRGRTTSGAVRGGGPDRRTPL